MAGTQSLLWVTWTSPKRTMRSGASPLIGWPSNSTEPLHAGSSPDTHLRRVDLPVPLPPSSATMAPSVTVKSTPRRILTLP